MADEKPDEREEIEELKALMQKNAAAMEKLRTMLANLEILLSGKEPPPKNPGEKIQ